MSGRADDPAFAARLLAERAAALAARREDREPDPGTDTRGWLVCEISGTLFAVEAAAVAVLQPFRCRPVPLLRPGAAGVVLGVTLLEGRLCSVLCLAQLLSDDRAGPAVEASGGTMLVLRALRLAAGPAAGGPVVAVRVDRVRGLSGIEPLPDGRRGLVRAGNGAAAGADAAPVALLAGADRIAAAVAALDGEQEAEAT